MHITVNTNNINQFQMLYATVNILGYLAISIYLLIKMSCETPLKCLGANFSFSWLDLSRVWLLYLTLLDIKTLVEFKYA